MKKSKCPRCGRMVFLTTPALHNNGTQVLHTEHRSLRTHKVAGVICGGSGTPVDGHPRLLP